MEILDLRGKNFISQESLALNTFKTSIPYFTLLHNPLNTTSSGHQSKCFLHHKDSLDLTSSPLFQGAWKLHKFF